MDFTKDCTWAVYFCHILDLKSNISGPQIPIKFSNFFVVLFCSYFLHLFEVYSWTTKILLNALNSQNREIDPMSISLPHSFSVPLPLSISIFKLKFFRSSLLVMCCTFVLTVVCDSSPHSCPSSPKSCTR